MGGGPASYIPAHTSSALAGKQSSVAGEPTEPPLRALVTQRAGALSLLTW